MTVDAGNDIVAFSEALADAVEAVASSVVTVEGRGRGGASGVIWRTGYVVTADHALERDENIAVGTAESTSEVSLVGRDPTTDLALLKLGSQAMGEPAVRSGQSIRVGQLVLAVGRPRDQGPSVSFGAMSTVGGSWRTWGGGRMDQKIHADITLYPGFSGGPLIDTTGGILGINTSGLSRGMPVTIPVTTVDRVVDALLKSGRIPRGYLGLRMHTVELPTSVAESLSLSDSHGLLVMGVEPEGPAEVGGALVGDIVVKVDGTQVSASDSLQTLLDSETVGRSVSLEVVRGGQVIEYSVTVKERPESGLRQRRRHHHG